MGLLCRKGQAGWRGSSRHCLFQPLGDSLTPPLALKILLWISGSPTDPGAETQGRLPPQIKATHQRLGSRMNCSSLLETLSSSLTTAAMEKCFSDRGQMCPGRTALSQERSSWDPWLVAIPAWHLWRAVRTLLGDHVALLGDHC